MAVSLEEQIKCVEREIKMRESLYPRWVLAEKMSQQKSAMELAAMRAVLDTLRDVEKSRLLL